MDSRSSEKVTTNEKGTPIFGKKLDIDEVINFSFKWFTNMGETLKFIGILLALGILEVLAIAGAVVFVFELSGIPIIKILSLVMSNRSAEIAQVMATMQNPNILYAFLYAIIGSFVAIVIIAFLFYLIQSFVEVKIFNFGFKSANIEKTDENIILGIKYGIFKIVKGLVTLFYSYNKTVLIIQILSLFLGITLFLSVLLLKFTIPPSFAVIVLLLLIIIFGIYLICVLYNIISLTIGNTLFLRDKNHKILANLKSSYEYIRGNLINTGLVILVIVVLSFIVNFIVNLPLNVMGEVAFKLFILQQNVFWLSVWVALKYVVNFLVSAFFIIIGIFMTVNIYKQLVINRELEKAQN